MEKEDSDSGRAKEKDKSWLLMIVAIVVIVAIGGAIAYINYKNDHNSSLSWLNPSASKPFDANPNSTDQMLIIVNTRVQGDGAGNNVNVLTNGKEDFKYMLMTNGKPINTSIYTPDALYTCNDPSSPCSKYPKPGPSENNPSYLTYTAAQIKKISNTSEYDGQKICPVGTGTGNCYVWKGGTATDVRLYYVNSTNKNLEMVLNYGHFGNTPITTTITYQYEPEQVPVPTNYITGKSQSQ